MGSYSIAPAATVPGADAYAPLLSWVQGLPYTGFQGSRSK